MFKWKKLGRIFNPLEVEGLSWMKEFAQAPAVLVYDKFIRVYFSCRSSKDSKGQYTSYSAFVDLDRNNLFDIVNISKTPILKLGELGTFDEFGTYPVSVIRHNSETIAYYAGWTRCQSIPFTVSIGIAKSFDNGKTFEKFGKGPVMSSNVNDPFVVGGPKIRRFNNQWVLWYVAVTEWLENEGYPDAVYRIRMATSSDGLNWERTGKNLLEYRIDEAECQASPDVFFNNSRYHMFFCYKHSLNFRENDEKKRGYRIGYAFSDDMINWTRDDSKAGISISDHGWDDQSIAYPHVFELEGKVYMLYLGNEVGRYGFGLAELEGNLN